MYKGVKAVGEELETAVIASVEVITRLNAAVTAWLEFIVTVHAPVPEQAPDHPLNVEPVFGVAVSATWVPVGKLRQPEPHETPAGAAVTVPLPEPDKVMVRAGRWDGLPTVRLIVPVTGPKAAVIVAMPADTPVTRPEALIVAMALFEELQFTALVMFR
jgi:hypothetical protein